MHGTGGSTSNTARPMKLSTKKLFVHPIAMVSCQRDLETLNLVVDTKTTQGDIRDLLQVSKKPTPASIRDDSTLPDICACEPSPVEMLAASSRSFEPPHSYITKTFATKTSDLLELANLDLLFLSTLHGDSLSEDEFINIVYRWEVESVKSSRCPIGQEMAKLIAQTYLQHDLSHSSLEALYKHWTSRWESNENRPICRAVWAYQQDLLAERSSLAHPKTVRHMRGRRRSTSFATTNVKSSPIK
jgi:hypothetical protein